jgi:hypothetical protein
MRLTTATRSLISLLCFAALAGCGAVPVTPWVKFTPYSNPVFDHQQFEDALNSWKTGRNVVWTVRFKSSDFADQELMLAGTGECSLGPRLATGSQQTRNFKPTKAELDHVIDRLIQSGVFTLYDGHYGPYSQGGGQGGPELTVIVNGQEKHVSKDAGLSFSREGDIIGAASEAVADVALAYIK